MREVDQVSCLFSCPFLVLFHHLFPPPPSLPHVSTPLHKRFIRLELSPSVGQISNPGPYEAVKRRLLKCSPCSSYSVPGNSRDSPSPTHSLCCVVIQSVDLSAQWLSLLALSRKVIPCAFAASVWNPERQGNVLRGRGEQALETHGIRSWYQNQAFSIWNIVWKNGTCRHHCCIISVPAFTL